VGIAEIGLLVQQVVLIEKFTWHQDFPGKVIKELK
jgi:hypothetical protein